MGRMTCPRCDSSISLVSSPSDHTGFFISNHDLEILEGIVDRARAHIIPDWFDKNCSDANRCPYCGYIWTFDPEPRSGYSLDETKAPRREWKPQPLMTLECQTEWCEDKGGFIRRSQADLEAAGGVILCDLCHQPYVKKE